MTDIWPGGVGGVLGDELVTATELYVTGAIYFVHHTGNNANLGRSRQKPFASLVFALTQIVAEDIIVLLDGHTETISAPQTIALNGVKVVAEGSSNGEPTVVITSGLTDQTMLTLSGTNIALGDIKFAAGGALSQVAQKPRINVTGVRSMIRGCRFEVNEDDQWFAVYWAATATGARMFECTGVSVSDGAQPAGILGASGPTDCEMEANTFDAGTSGFYAGGFFDLSVLAGTGPQRLSCQQMRLLNGANFGTGVDTTGHLGIAEKSGGPIVQGFARRLPNGFRQTGDAMLADTEFYYSGTIYYAHYGTGDDANSGVDEMAPKKTLAGALAVAVGDCDIVVLLPGHAEPVTAGIVGGGEGMIVIGCGTSNGRPSCRLYQNAAGPFVVFTFSATGQATRNIWFDETTSGVTQARMVWVNNNNYCEVRGCLARVGYRDHIGIEADSSFCTIRETKIESTGTTAALRPAIGLYMISEGTMTDADVRGTEISNGTHGFSSLGFSEAEPMPRLYVIDMTLSFGADATINPSSSGIVNPETASGSAAVNWG